MNRNIFAIALLQLCILGCGGRTTVEPEDVERYSHIEELPVTDEALSTNVDVYVATLDHFMLNTYILPAPVENDEIVVSKTSAFCDKNDEMVFVDADGHVLVIITATDPALGCRGSARLMAAGDPLVWYVIELGGSAR
jgi:hypothetical protein